MGARRSVRRPRRGSSKRPHKKKSERAPRFAKDIRPLFRSGDIDHMKSIAGFDLSRLEDVQKHVGVIFVRLSTKTMPPDRPWSDSRIAKFKQWMDGGMKP
jgi:hypothetical protein